MLSLHAIRPLVPLVVLLAVMLLPSAAPTRAFTPPASGVYVALDCDTSTAAIDDNCAVPVGATTLDVAIVLGNNSGFATSIRAFNFEVNNSNASALKPAYCYARVVTDIFEGDTTINLDNTTELPSSGNLTLQQVQALDINFPFPPVLRSEIISYTAKTATSLTGVSPVVGTGSGFGTYAYGNGDGARLGGGPAADLLPSTVALPGCDANRNSNPDFNDAAVTGSFVCFLPPPLSDTGAIAGGSQSFLACFSGFGDGPTIPNGGTIVLGTVHFNVVGTGTTTLSWANVAVSNNSLNEIGSCNPGIDVPIPCFGATIGRGREFQVFGAHAWETSLAVDPNPLKDPNRTDHVVVGFNVLDGNNDVQSCSWAETHDGGDTWDSGSVQLPNGFQARGDPWVRFSRSGELYYSCIATSLVRDDRTRKTWDWRVVVARSSSGLPRFFGNAQTVAQGLQIQRCNIVTTQCADTVGSETFDRPAFATMPGPSGQTRLVACWLDNVRVSSNEVASSIATARSDDGLTWSGRRILAQGSAIGNCAVGGSDTQLAVTWWDPNSGPPGGTLELRRTANGLTWSPRERLARVGPLVPACVGLSFGCSTTSRVLSLPFALVTSSGGNLRAIYQVRVDGYSRVYVADFVGGSWQSTPVGDPNTETFLQGAGGCSEVVGVYESNPRITSTFRYTLWAVSETRSSSRLFTSTQGLSGGDSVSGFLLPRIGEYTGVDCSLRHAWAAWADNRTGQVRIWGSRVAIGP